MADEFQTGFCAGNWWNSSKTVFGSSPCSSALNDIGSLGWGSELVDMKERSSDASGNSVSDGSLLFQDIQKHNQTMDSTMGIGLSSSTDWNQALNSGSGRTARNDNPMLQEDLNSSLNYRQENGIRKDWSPKNFSSDDEDSSINAFKIPNQGFSLDSMSSTSYGYPSNFVQALFDDNSQPQQSLIDNQSINYPFTTNNYQTKLNEFSPSLPKFSSLLRPSLPKHQPIRHLHLSNHTPFLNYASAGALSDIRASFFASTQSQFLPSTFEEKPNFSNLTKKLDDEEVGDSGSVVKKGSNEPAFKRQRIETPSPLPTFRVRKEKLGDRITALQQLVSPFGKTDTASVLHEAIEYIKLLHGQVNILSTPYMRSGAPIQLEQIHDNLKDTKVPKQNLRSRGLCLVQIPSTFPVAPETTADFWTPTFEGAFR